MNVSSIWKPITLGRVSAITHKLQSRRYFAELSNGRNFPGFSGSLFRPSYAFNCNEWRELIQSELVSKWPTIKLVTWNINRLGCSKRRRKATEFLEEICLDQDFKRVPSIVCLQEVTPTFLELLKHTLWIQSHFQLTNIDSSCWLSRSNPPYGTLTLIDCRLPVSSTFRIPYKSKQGRDALFVDLLLENPFSRHPALVRVCNTHLESFNDCPPVRAGQLAMASTYVHARQVYAGIVAGDFNSIDPGIDPLLHLGNRLKDAYLEHGAQGDGNTWGMHSKRISTLNGRRAKLPLGRLDKICYAGEVRMGKPEAIRRNLTIDYPGRPHYVSDHLGLRATMELS